MQMGGGQGMQMGGGQGVAMGQIDLGFAPGSIPAPRVNANAAQGRQDVADDMEDI